MENKAQHFIVRKSTLLYIGWVLFIALLTLLPGGAIPDINWSFMEVDKWIHFSVLAILSWIGVVSFKQQANKLATKAIFISIAIALLYGTVLEFSQSMVPDRSFDYADLVANYAGSLFGYVLFRVFYNILYR